MLETWEVRHTDDAHEMMQVLQEREERKKEVLDQNYYEEELGGESFVVEELLEQNSQEEELEERSWVEGHLVYLVR